MQMACENPGEPGAAMLGGSPSQSSRRTTEVQASRDNQRPACPSDSE